MTSARLTMATLGVAALTAACGGTVGPTGPDTTTTAGSTAPTSTPDAIASVELEQFAYLPAELEVAVGTAVTWTNLDDTEHTVTSGTPDAPDKGTFDHDLEGADDRFTFTFNAAGTYPYHCVLHPFMQGTITVTG